jgi:hypothetical protein
MFGLLYVDTEGYETINRRAHLWFIYLASVEILHFVHLTNIVNLFNRTSKFIFESSGHRLWLLV